MTPSTNDVTRFTFTFDDIGTKMEPYPLASGSIGVCDPSYFAEGYGDKKTEYLYSKKGKHVCHRVEMY